MRTRVSRSAVWIVALLLGAAGVSIGLLRGRPPTPGESLARAAGPRILKDASAALWTSITGKVLLATGAGIAPGPGGVRFSIAGIGIGPGETWYAIDATAGNLSQGNLASGAAAVNTGSLGTPSAPPIDAAGLLFVASSNPAAAVSAIDLSCALTVWRSPFGQPVRGLAIVGGRLFAAAPDEIRALDAGTGRTLWSHRTTGVTTGVAATRDRVGFGTSDGLFHVLDSTDGRALHRVTLDRPAAGRVAVEGDVAFVLAGPHADTPDLPLYAVDLRGGRVKWRHAGPSAMVLVGTRRASGPVAGEGVVCFSFADWLHAIDARTGAQRWRFQPAREDDLNLWRRSSLYDPLVGDATIRDGVVYVTAADRIVGLDREAGHEVWRYQPPYSPAWGRPSFVAPVVRGNLVLGVLGQTTLLAVPLAPQALANAPLSPPRSGTVRAPVLLAAAGALIVVAIAAVLTHWWRACVAGLCLALCGLAAWTWARSYAAEQFVGQQRQTSTALYNQLTRRGIHSADGAVTIGVTREVWQTGLRRAVAGDTTGGLGWVHEPHDRTAQATHEFPRDLGMLHFAITRRARPSGTTLGEQAEASITLPHWLLIVTLGIPPLAWLTGHWRDRRRYPKGHCPNCGYDLRETPGRCPECGLEIKMQHQSDPAQMDTR